MQSKNNLFVSQHTTQQAKTILLIYNSSVVHGQTDS
jgi:hypothetical protein